MSDTSSSDQFFWDENPYHWIGEEDDGGGEVDLGEGAVDGQGEGEDDHPFDNLHHLMIMPPKVPIGGEDNDNVGVEMQIPAPEPRTMLLSKSAQMPSNTSSTLLMIRPPQSLF